MPIQAGDGRQSRLNSIPTRVTTELPESRKWFTACFPPIREERLGNSESDVATQAEGTPPQTSVPLAVACLADTGRSSDPICEISLVHNCSATGAYKTPRLRCNGGLDKSRQIERRADSSAELGKSCTLTGRGLCRRIGHLSEIRIEDVPSAATSTTAATFMRCHQCSGCMGLDVTSIARVADCQSRQKSRRDGAHD